MVENWTNYGNAGVEESFVEEEDDENDDLVMWEQPKLTKTESTPVKGIKI